MLDLKADAGGTKETLKRAVTNANIVALLMLILATMGLIGVLIGQIDERKKEFGIRISCGAKITTLCKEVIFEVVILVGIAAVIPIIIGMRLSNDINTKIIVCLLNIGMILLITSISTIMPIMKLRKINPVDLVKGE